MLEKYHIKQSICRGVIELDDDALILGLSWYRRSHNIIYPKRIVPQIVFIIQNIFRISKIFSKNDCISRHGTMMTAHC